MLSILALSLIISSQNIVKKCKTCGKTISNCTYKGMHPNRPVTTSSNEARPLSFNPMLCPDNKHPHIIDLGLPSGTKWACCNVGAKLPENYGGYFAWGETQKKRIFTWETYKYGESREKCQDIGNSISGTIYDVAHVQWKDKWQMPTMTQILELINCTKQRFTTINGVNGVQFTSSDSNSIFIPAGGYYDKRTLYGDSLYVNVWSSTLEEEKLSIDYDYCAAHQLRWQGTSPGLYDIKSTSQYRASGLNVRPVYVSN